jgi:signal transduction histidine kinase
MTYLIRSLIGFALILMSAESQVFAREHIVDRAFVSDPSGSWTLEQARQQPLTAFKGILTEGYGSGPIWVRLRIDPRASAAAPTDRLFLRIRPMYLDSIQLFDQAEGYAPRPAVGDRQPMAAQIEPAPFFLLKVPAGDTPRELWLRVKSTSTRMAYFEVLDESTLRDSKLKIQSLTSAYLATIGFFLVIGLLRASWQRDGLSLAFIFYQILALLNGLLSFGYARWLTDGWIPPALLDGVFSLHVIGFVYGLLFFGSALSRELAHGPLRTNVFFGFCAVLFLLIGLQFSGLIQLSLAIANLAGLILPTIFFLDAIFQVIRKRESKQEAGLPKPAIVTYFGLSAVFAYLAVLPIMGWSPAEELNLYAVPVYVFSSGVLMLWLLNYRAQLNAKQRDQLLIETRQANERAEFECIQRMERQQLLNMLGHELKTPMAALKMLLGDQEIPKEWAQRLGRPLNDMNEVVERTVQSGQLEDGGIEVRWQTCDVVNLIEDKISSLPDSKRVAFTFKGGIQGATLLRTDPYLLSIVIRNLLDNALKYSPDGSAVELRLNLGNQGDNWSLTFKSEVGRAGLPDPEKIFVRFWRSPKATYRTGSGQGLYIARRIVHLLRGDLKLEPETNMVLFRLTLPYHPGLEDQKII